MVIKVGINGFGRIGRVIFRTCVNNSNVEISAINDPAIEADYICYLIKFDSTHGKFKGNISHIEDEIKINGNIIKVFHQKVPKDIPWQTAGVEYVIEASGMFTSLEKASGHLASESVKRVIVTAPSVDVPMIILGVNDSKLSSDHKVISCASSTLYCLAPIIKLLEDNYGVSEGFITSIHAMTPSLKPLDGLCIRGRHWRDHRSIHQNIIPAATGACRAIGKIIPQVKDKMSGLAFRVPIVNVSVLDITIRLKTNTKLQNIKHTVEKASLAEMINIINISQEKAVSSDFVGDTYSCTLDLDSSIELKPDFFKLICWYENEYSYACRVIDTIMFSEKQLKSNNNNVKQTLLKLLMKQDVKNKTECQEFIKREINNSLDHHKMFGSTSQDTGFNFKLPPQLTHLRKPLSSHDPKNISITNKDAIKKYEPFKIWNDNNKNSIYQRCMTLAPIVKRKDDLETHEHLELVKNEFIKMVNMTEHLLTKSYSKLKLNSNKKSSNEELTVNNISSSNCTKARDCENDKSFQNNVSVLNVSGDYCRNNYNQSINNNNNTVALCQTSCYDDQFDRNTQAKLPPYNDLDSYTTINNHTQTINKPRKNSAMQTFACVELKKPLKEPVYYKHHSVETINMSPDRLVLQRNQTARVHDETKIRKMLEYKKSNTHIVNNDIIKAKMESKTKENDDQVYLKNANNLDCSFPKAESVKSVKVIQGIQHPSEIVRDEHNQPTVSDYLDSRRKIDEELKKRDILLVTDQTKTEVEINTNADSNNDNSDKTIDEDSSNIIKYKELVPDIIANVSENCTRKECYNFRRSCMSPNSTTTTISNGDRYRNRQDIYDKLDSSSETDSENSFQIHEKKSQVINVCDLINSLEDLSRLDKICRIIEISDELSDKLFSALDDGDSTNKEVTKKKWSFKDLCERINLDDFCNKIFGSP